MLTRLRSSLLAGGGAVLLVIAVSGIVAASSILTAIAAPTTDTAPPTLAADTTATFEDADGDGVDDDCDEAVVADPVASAAAEAAADLDGDGTISVSEAAQSDRLGGTNCNHGGYVSGVANGADECDAKDEPAGTETDEDADAGDDAETASVVLVTETDDAACDADEDADETADEAADEEDASAECTAETPETEPVVDDAPTDTAPNAHGKAVSDVAQSDAVGGKNCNHGGAVSEAAKKDQEAAKAARDEAKAGRDAAKAERRAEHASKAPKTHGKKHGG